MRLAVLLSALSCLFACQGGGGARPPAEPRSTLLRGERETSGPRKASAARPRPGAEPEEHPLEGDRLALDQASARARRAHGESHAAASLELEEFSHPACGALPQAERRACPLSSVQWTGLREVEGGLELETRDPKIDASRLRWRFLCHVAFARMQQQPHGCPLGTPGLEVSVVNVRGRTTVRLTTAEGGRVSALRRELRDLVGAR